MFSSCGSGLSGDYLSDEGHYWVGIDISSAMLGEYALFHTRVATLVNRVRLYSLSAFLMSFSPM